MNNGKSRASGTATDRPDRNMSGFTKENLLLILPPALRRDASIVALAETAAEALAERLTEIDRVRVISNIDGLEEAVLDILAKDFKVDWWDADYSLEEKRRTLKSSWRVHKTLGTKAALEEAVNAIYPGSAIEEWFDYGGEPHHFRISVKNNGAFTSMESLAEFLRLVESVKRLSSWLDTITIITDLGEATVRAGGRMAAVTRIPIPAIADVFSFYRPMRTGGLMASKQRIPIPAVDNDITLTSTGRIGVKGAVTVSVPMPEITQ